MSHITTIPELHSYLEEQMVTKEEFNEHSAIIEQTVCTLDAEVISLGLRQKEHDSRLSHLEAVLGIAPKHEL
ncbi:MAG: hypothetical protein HW383_728 [Candidatus Magasanikbacteria bacterium]|nr:hypothetical protein [Candidatus Magasanikbacteria bacterium]